MFSGGTERGLLGTNGLIDLSTPGFAVLTFCCQRVALASFALLYKE